MKRIISALLTFAMLLTLITVPMMVTADAYSAPATWENTSDLFDTDAAMLYAVKGTPTVDGIVEAKWANAYTTRVDRSQMCLMYADKYSQSMFADYYMMWDENNLYILEERQWDDLNWLASPAKEFWGSCGDCSCFYISLPMDWSDDSTRNDGAVNRVNVHVGNSTAIGTPAKGSVAQDNKYYTANTPSNTATGWSWKDSIVTYTTLTETGFIMETAIPWAELDDYNPGFSAEADLIFGLVLQINGWSIGNKVNKQSTDQAGFQQVKLVEGTNPTIKPATPDVTWYTSNPNADVFYINDADDLLGWVELTQRHGSSVFAADTGTKSAIPLFTGKKVVLNADITFNAGTTFNADGTWTGNTPVNGWGTILQFAGEFDGQGHTISGLYAPIGYTVGQDTRYMGFFGRLDSGSSVHDVTFKNGYLKQVDYNTSDDKKMGVGTVASVVHGGSGSGTITIKNVSSNLTIVGATDLCGGITGSSYAGSNFNTFTLDNVVYTGTVIAGVGGGATGLSGRLEWSNSGVKAIEAVTKNCYTLAGAQNVTVASDGSTAAAIQATPVAEGKFDIRVLGLIDEAELNLDEVGMKITVTYTDASGAEPVATTYQPLVTSGTRVFKTVNANGTPIEVSSISADAEYAYGAVLTNVPAGATDTVKITVVLTRTIDGVEVESTCAYSATYLAGVKQ